jgi:hypothetical protein
MAIFGIGAYYDEDVSQDFINAKIVGVGWNSTDAPELHQFIRALRVGDIVYIKAYSPRSADIVVKAVGLVVDDVIRTAQDTNGLVQVGRNVTWLRTTELRIPKPHEKNNVRANTMYEEFHPDVQKAILREIRC